MLGRLLAWPFRIVMLAALAVYKLIISPVFFAFGVRCRHEPSCSSYSQQAIKQHGPWLGGWMTLARLLRCQPFERLGGTCGVDNVPKKHYHASYICPLARCQMARNEFGP